MSYKYHDLSNVLQNKFSQQLERLVGRSDRRCGCLRVRRDAEIPQSRFGHMRRIRVEAVRSASDAAEFPVRRNGEPLFDIRHPNSVGRRSIAGHCGCS